MKRRERGIITITQLRGCEAVRNGPLNPRGHLAQVVKIKICPLTWSSLHSSARPGAEIPVHVSVSRRISKSLESARIFLLSFPTDPDRVGIVSLWRKGLERRAMATFRVCVFGVRAACAGCYHLRLQTKSICDESPAHMGRCSVRTETSLMTTLPTFTNNVFVLNSPRAVSDLQPGVSLLSVDLFVRLPPVARSWSEAEEEKYEVVAGGNVVLNASQLQKFAGCERVSVTVELNGHQPHAQDAVDAPQYEVSLDMMCISGPKWIPTAAGGVREKGLECGVLVAKASSLPLVSDAVGKRQPSCFVAVSTLRDKGKRRPPRGMTAVVPNTSEPAWEEFLQLDLSDCVIARDSLVLDVVDEVSQKSLLECCVPMETVSPGQHHNFNFYSTDGEEPSLTATMHIPLTSNQWESSDDESSGDDNEKLWIAAAVFQTNIAGKEAYNCDGLIARFSISDRKEPPEFPDYNDFMEIDTTQEDHGKVIRKAMKKARKCIPGDFFVDVVPLESRQKGALWPFGHPGMVQCERAAAKHLVIAIYQMYYNPEEGNSKLLGSAALNLNNRGGHLSSSTSLLDTLDLVDKEGVHIGEVSVQVSKTTPDIMKNGNGPATVSRMIGAYGECPYYQKPGMGYAIEWFGLNGNSLKKKLKLTSLSAGQPQASTLAIIVDDMHTKQHALERLQWSMDTVETSCQVYRCRIQDSEMKRKQMSQQLSHLQVLLHKERNAVQSPLSINNPDNKMHKVEDLKEHINKVVTSLHKEKRRNKQLEHQLQHLHNQQVKNLDDRKKHAELEDAHLFQAKQIRCRKIWAMLCSMNTRGIYSPPVL